MNEVFETLPALQERYRNYNLLLPTATDVQLNPFYKYHVEEVPVDTSETTGDIFKVGSVKTGNTLADGKDEYVDVYSLSKPLLNRMATAVGIQFSDQGTYWERPNSTTVVGHAYGAMRKADGTARMEADLKVICLEDEEEKYRMEFADKAEKGITEKKAAESASELFAGKWIKAKNKWGKVVDAYLIDEKDRSRYIERSVKANLANLKKTWAEKAITGAKLRVIRALLGIKGTYTMSELKKNFAITTVIFSPDYSDPQVRRAMLERGLNSMNNMFGVPEIPVRRMNFESETVYDAEADLDNPAFASDSDPDDVEVTESAEQAATSSASPDPAPTHMEPVYPERSRAEDFQCSKCGAVINEKVYEYSINKFGQPLCFGCQKKMTGKR